MREFDELVVARRGAEWSPAHAAGNPEVSIEALAVLAVLMANENAAPYGVVLRSIRGRRMVTPLPTLLNDLEMLGYLHWFSVEVPRRRTLLVVSDEPLDRAVAFRAVTL